MSHFEIFKNQDVLTYKFKYQDASELSDLTVSEKLYLETITSQDRKKSFLSSHLLLNHLLRNEFKIQNPKLKRLDSGQWVLDHPLYFSISHSENQIFIGLALTPIGVDVQHIQNISNKVLKKIFHLNEYRFLEDTVTATSLFSLKESYGKAIGKGLANSKNMDFSPYIKNNFEYLTFQTNDSTLTLEKEESFVYSHAVLKK